MKRPDRLVLASQSPRRRAILRFAQIPFRVIRPQGVKESIRAGEKPGELVKRLALEKAQAVAKRHPESPVLGADTIVFCRGKIYGKPANRNQAWKMLRRLEGRTHTVWTGTALVWGAKGFVQSHAEKTQVAFRKLTNREMENYLGTKEPYDKAGAYDIRGSARNWIRDWEGDYFNVVGLPLRWVVEKTNFLFNRSGKL